MNAVRPTWPLLTLEILFVFSLFSSKFTTQTPSLPVILINSVQCHFLSTYSSRTVRVISGISLFHFATFPLTVIHYLEHKHALKSLPEWTVTDKRGICPHSI